MFSLGENMVVDATQTGGLARYINHCCDPNCYTEIIHVEKERKIVIISNRKIMRGEEVREGGVSVTGRYCGECPTNNIVVIIKDIHTLLRAVINSHLY